MKIHKLKDFTKGWFIGNFDPSLLKTDDFEIAVKEYTSGDYEESHHHKIATEYTIVISGHVKMNGEYYNKNDIIIIEPNESTDFLAMDYNVKTLVIKTPCVKGDKYVD